LSAETVAAAFAERYVEVDGVPVRSMEAGAGVPLVWLHGAGAFQLTQAHELLSRRFRTFAFDVSSGAGLSASTIARATEALGIDRFNLLGTSSGATAALRLAVQVPARVQALVLETPASDADADLGPRLSDVAAPTLVLLGTAVDTGTTATARMFKARIPNSYLVLVYAAGHAIGADRPEAFADVVADFLERREAFVISRTPTLIHP
jgi:pimeloyl-ACP methyl ester carboxylesterase